MLTSTLTLTSDEIDLLLSLSDLELETWLKRFTPQAQAEILSQLESHTGGFKPTPRQAEFKALDCVEALYGGAAGGGKSEALLDWLAQGIDIPGYTGIIFRRTYPQLIKSNEGLIAKSFRMYKPLGGLWNGTEKQWRFPSGAMIELGHLPYETSVYDYQGPSYHRIAFDELTQFTENQYTYLFSRKRMGIGFPISLGMRAASNPGGPGHEWVKARFVTSEALEMMRGLKSVDPTPAGTVFWPNKDRAFVPARLADNPYIDMHDYLVNSLGHLPAVLRERLANGDWSIREEGLIRLDWLRYYFVDERHPGLLQFYDKKKQNAVCSVHERDCRRIATIDTAGTSEDKAKEAKGKPSWSVVSIWDIPPAKFGPIIAWRHVWRRRVSFNELLDGVRDTLREWKPERAYIENAQLGPAVHATLERERFRIELISHESKGKVERNTPFLLKMEKGEVFLPEAYTEWKEETEAELLTWDGHPDTPCDIIDTGGYAAIKAAHSGQTRLESPVIMPRQLYRGSLGSITWN